MPMRIQVIFGETSLLVPCGDGKLKVSELIEKSVTRFKKVITKHPEDVIEVRSLRLAESGSFVDEDDEVADVLEDKETVILDYEYYPHQDSTPLHNISISDDSAIAGTSSQPFSPINLDGDHTHFTNDTTPLSSLADKGYGEGGVSMSDANNLSSAEESQDEDEHVTPPHHTSQDMGHLDNASQEQGELSGGHNWHSLTTSSQSQEHSPHLTRKTVSTWQSASVPAPREIVLDSQDSGYAPTKSQESYGHSKSQEIYSTDLSFHHISSSQGQGDAPIHAGQLPPYSAATVTGNQLSSEGTGSQTNLSRISKVRENVKEETVRKTSFDGSVQKSSLFNKPQNNRFGQQRSFRGDGGMDGSQRGGDGSQRGGDGSQRGGDGGMDGSQRGREAFVTYSRALDIPGHFGRPNSISGPGYSNSYSDSLRTHEPWRRSLTIHGDYKQYHDMSPYGGGGQRYGEYHNDPFHYQGGSTHYPRPHDSLPAHFPGVRRGDFRNARTLSHERLDQVPPPYAWPGRTVSFGHPGIDEDTPTEYFLSQPNPSYTNYDRPGTGPPHVNLMNSFDSRFAMSGPSGVSLSQPGMMFSHGGGRGMFDYDRRGGPWGQGDHRGSGKMQRGGGTRNESGRVQPVEEEEFEPLDIDDEIASSHGGKGRCRPSPFQRDSRKSMFRDGPLYSQWMERLNEYEIQDNTSEVPVYDNSQPQRSRTPSPTEQSTKAGTDDHTPSHGEDESDEDDEFGNIHIVELHKGEELLGIYLTHYTSPDGRDLGVFIGDMDENGFAAKSGKLRHQDRILACNGVDFTKELTNDRVEEIFMPMSEEPLLRMAISRGLQTNLMYPEDTSAEGENAVGVASDSKEKMENSDDIVPAPPKIVSNPSQPPSVALTNTRQMGIKHVIKLVKTTPTSPLGFGVTSRDVTTDDKNQPFYVKSINSGTPAFMDGRLKIGDRLLEVNGRDVIKMSRPEVVSLLRQPLGEVTLVISRQEMVEQETEEYGTSPSPSINAQSSVVTQTTTVGKSVLTLTIPLPNSGSAGLGVTVYGRTALRSTRKAGDMGIYIKSIVPGGAAALDGRLRKNDQILCVNKENLLGGSNQEALDKLRSALSKASSSEVGRARGGECVELVVARRVHNPGSSMSPSMAALGEEPEEEERDNTDTGKEVGIDVLIDSPADLLEGAPSTTSLISQGSAESRPGEGLGRIGRLISQTSLTEEETLRSSIRERNRSATVSGTPPSRVRFKHNGRSTSPLLIKLKKSEGILGSGEFDRLEPINVVSHSPRSPHEKASRYDLQQSTHLKNRHPLTMQDELTTWYNDAANSVLTAPPFDPRMRTASLDRRSHREYLSPDYKESYLTHSQTSDCVSGSSNKMEGMVDGRNHDMYRVPHGYSGPMTGTTIVSPSRRVIQTTPSGQSSQEGHLQRSQYSPQYNQSPSNQSPNNLHQNQQTTFSSYGGDGAPTRGSGRRDRNKPERGSGRHQTSSYSSNSSSVSPSISMMMSPDITGGAKPAPNSFSTLPRSGSRSSERGSNAGQLSNTETSSLCSLEHLRLSDSESNIAFRRDEPGRISITKKTKKNPRRDFAHMHFDNVEPLVEGENPGLFRTGSDGCLNETAQSSLLQHSLQGMELGPQLGLAKSSSLESLHNVMHHTIKRDIVDDSRDLRNHSTRISFQQAVDCSYDNMDDAEGKQRGVDVTFDLHEGVSVPAVMSYTKNPVARKSKKPGFLKKFMKNTTKKRKPTKKERPLSISTPVSLQKRESTVDIILEQENFSSAERELLRTGFTIPVRLGDDSIDDIHIPGDNRYSDELIGSAQLLSGHHRHSMPILDDYDSSTSPDEALLATMARV